MSTATPSSSRPGPRGAALTRAGVLADSAGGTAARELLLVAGGAALVGAAAQVSVPLPFTPVPLTLQTLAVLLVGAGLGARRGAASLALYAAAGLAGAPWFAGRAGGAALVRGPLFGYVLGFVAAAAVVGALAGRRGDRTVLRAAGSTAVGTAVVYLVAIAWWVLAVGAPVGVVLAQGVAPFLLGDGLKVAAAALLLPGVWRLLPRR